MTRLGAARIVVSQSTLHCSYDARERSEANKDKSRHWVDSKAWRGNRVTYNEKESPPYLALENAAMKDTGVYRCRVDFANSPTGHSLVNLTVVSEYPKPEAAEREVQPEVAPHGERPPK